MPIVAWVVAVAAVAAVGVVEEKECWVAVEEVEVSSGTRKLDTE